MGTMKTAGIQSRFWEAEIEAVGRTYQLEGANWPSVIRWWWFMGGSKIFGKLFELGINS